MTDTAQGRMRLQKFLARAGVASRRKAEELIRSGRVSVCGQVITKLGTTIDPAYDSVLVDGVMLKLDVEPKTIMLYKPLEYVTTMSDTHAKHTVKELIPTDEYPSLYPIGRLDRDTTGLLLFSTDGELGYSLLRPCNHVIKRYFALIDGIPNERDLRFLRSGVGIDGMLTLPAEFTFIKEESVIDEALGCLEIVPHIHKRYFKQYRMPIHLKKMIVSDHKFSLMNVGIHEGKNRQIRRMFQSVGHPVVALHRYAFGPLKLSGLKCGTWRLISSDQDKKLRSAAHIDE